jgi:hypothetical protein
MSVAKGILTARGGMTSHAAVVARGLLVYYRWSIYLFLFGMMW